MNMKNAASKHIPNIDIGQAYDRRYIDSEVHFEQIQNLAQFFGHDMPVHYHDRFYQIHVVMSGEIRLQLDNRTYQCEGPVLFFTPPTVPHGFTISTETEGYVLTIRQQFVWQILSQCMALNDKGLFATKGICIPFKKHSNALKRTLAYLTLLEDEHEQERTEKAKAMYALVRLILIEIIRMSGESDSHSSIRDIDAQIFHQFHQLIEANFVKHWTLSRYATELCVTESRLNSICQRVSSKSAKRLVNERVLQESKRLIGLTQKPITQIGYELGFQDPAYFARFFRRMSGVTASNYRESQQRQAVS
ncbi:4-hydroxyphenylacetate catabolism regulatory protein HpaA [Vibrio nigripulchritudo]|uniref:4-hydroxyphenylacetate catabolism regulatory protein HpaA n=1 Tax=Vibrio nigripulchritudo TaxID=28173 RepID=UPI0024921FDE|nr:4-hydroxyphenylacetate catabolism regulatory protein HpaA [Vibrio nigripulchritudo]BDU40884.1 transcriptional regulator [Vibrio nigripulchritudo]BDU46622.1 transcriptional regulator [Vibrio nigripulchritudo]